MANATETNCPRPKDREMSANDIKSIEGSFSDTHDDGAEIFESRQYDNAKESDGQPENGDTGVNTRIKFFNSISVQSQKEFEPPQEQSGQSQDETEPPQEQSGQSQDQSEPPQEQSGQSQDQSEPPQEQTGQFQDQSEPPLEQSGQSPENVPLINISQNNEEPETVEIETQNDVRYTKLCYSERTVMIINIILSVGIFILTAALIAVIVHFTSKQQEIGEEKQLIGPQNDPFFTAAFPQKGSTVIIKCFLPFKGTYTLHTIFEKENKNSNITDICSTGDTKHHYKLYCNKDHRTGCKGTVCRNNCTKFDISLSEMHLILLELDDICLASNGRIEIWNSTIIKVTR
ncbi:unnamed protein product [Mytilus coruscus]|uniref:Uncharacterized protein n=1 Tax=Mytilus coruscus TaxID=42192 RepID=A0A6J8C8F1_MYTCO|nr:unnamed protein product [Mytilus coruscus]